MKLLFITNHFLDANGGGSFASRAYANAFAELADDCFILYPDRKKSVKEFIHSKFKLKGCYNYKNKFQKLIDIYSGRIHRYSEVAIEEINNFSPDLVVFDNSRCSAGLITQVKQLGIKVICIHHNYEMEYYRGSPPNILWRWVFMRYMKKAEQEAITFSDLNLTLTQEDIDLLQSVYDLNKESKFARLGCFESKDLKLDVVQENESNLNLKFVITGSLSSHQTEVSLLPFLKNFYPNLVALYPESELIIAGKDPSENIKTVCNNFPSITLIPNPTNMQEVIAEADIYICPNNVGGGLKLRLMDGLKAGLPVISHGVSARGYDAFLENGCLFVYKDENSFIKELNVLLMNRENNKLTPLKIIKIYQQNFSFASGIERLRSILKSEFSL